MKSRNGIAELEKKTEKAIIPAGTTKTRSLQFEENNLIEAAKLYKRKKS